MGSEDTLVYPRVVSVLSGDLGGRRCHPVSLRFLRAWAKGAPWISLSRNWWCF